MTQLRAIAITAEEIALDETLVTDFKSRLQGQLLCPGDPGYDEARQVWNGMIDKRPALIARCIGTADIIDAINFARTHRLLVAVRGGGHNVAGNAVCDGGLVIDLSLMRGVHVDPKARTARVQGGATWGDVDRETQVFALATPGGQVSTTGVAGFTLGGGMGNMRRKYGLSIDNLLSVDIVTADGQILTASPTENPDLFWGVRGGGGNFGVVTSFEFRLHPVGPMVMLGAPMYPEEQAGEILRSWREFMAAAPDELSSMAAIWAVPPAPHLPPEIHGKPVVLLAGVYAGPVEEGERVVQPLRELGTPLADLSGPMPYTVLQRAFDPFFPKGELLYYVKSLNLDHFSDEAIEVLLSHAAQRPSPLTLVLIWHQGGAISRVGAEETAFGRRDAPFMLSIDSAWTDPRDTEKNISWSRALWSAMRPFSTGGLYLNFPGLGEEKEVLVRAAYGPNYDRLVALKNKYDPTNLFRMNQNIAPTV